MEATRATRESRTVDQAMTAFLQQRLLTVIQYVSVGMRPAIQIRKGISKNTHNNHCKGHWSARGNYRAVAAGLGVHARWRINSFAYPSERIFSTWQRDSIRKLNDWKDS
jgi:hypothetical protein